MIRPSKTSGGTACGRKAARWVWPLASGEQPPLILRRHLRCPHVEVGEVAGVVGIWEKFQVDGVPGGPNGDAGDLVGNAAADDPQPSGRIEDGERTCRVGVDDQPVGGGGEQQQLGVVDRERRVAAVTICVHSWRSSSLPRPQPWRPPADTVSVHSRGSWPEAPTASGPPSSRPFDRGGNSRPHRRTSPTDSRGEAQTGTGRPAGRRGHLRRETQCRRSPGRQPGQATKVCH